MSTEGTIRLTTAQAVVRFLAAQYVDDDGQEARFLDGVWAIFGHGNVAGLGEALYHAQDELPTYRAHNEQSMAHAAIAYAKAKKRRRAMICTTSIGPGATNMVTAAALAHVNRLPVLFLPGDVYASRRPDPVLQQIEDFDDGVVSANDCFRPVSRYFDRINRPEQILNALPRAMMTLTEPAKCGPVTISLCQDVQAEAFDYPTEFFNKRVWSTRGGRVAKETVSHVAALISKSQKPMIIAGGGVHYADATDQLKHLVDTTGIPVGETQGGKGALAWDHPACLGSIGVTGAEAANAAAREADLIIGVGTRLQDFTTASRTLFENPDAKFVQINIASFDAYKHNATPMTGDARTTLSELTEALQNFYIENGWRRKLDSDRHIWLECVDNALRPRHTELPSDAEVIGAVMGTCTEDSVVVCAAGGLPGELHKLWKTSKPGGYHVEYGYSCMGYEIAGGLGVKLAQPDRDVNVMVGDGSYLMMNSEIATAVSLGIDLTIVVLDNRGFGCINRLQQASGGAPFNNLLVDSRGENDTEIDFAQHAASMGANAVKVESLNELHKAVAAGKERGGVSVVVIDTDPMPTTKDGGAWWDVAVPETSPRENVGLANQTYKTAIKKQRRGG